MPQRADALARLEQAISRAAGAKVMLRMEEAQLIRAVLKGEPPAVCALHAHGLACRCQLMDPNCEHRLTE